jgi:hypothetical protein
VLRQETCVDIVDFNDVYKLACRHQVSFSNFLVIIFKISHSR